MTDPGRDWFEAMYRGDLESAWLASDRVLKVPIPADEFTNPRHLQRIWNGESLENKHVLVRCYHGLGDTIQFARFLPLLVERAASVTTWIQPELIPLMRRQAGFGEFAALHDGAPDVAYDVDIEIMELAHALRATREMISTSVPYLHLAQQETVQPRAAVGRPRVGVVWRAGDWDNTRSLSNADLQLLALARDIEWHVLQLGESAGSFPHEWGAPPACSDIVVAAKRMVGLDLLVSVDSMPAHLAGAMGVPVWLLLRANADWRWGRESHTPWYPSMRLIRQICESEWAVPLQQVVQQLATLL